MELNKVGSPIEQAGKIYFLSVSNLQEAPVDQRADQKQNLALAQMNSVLNTYSGSAGNKLLLSDLIKEFLVNPKEIKDNHREHCARG